MICVHITDGLAVCLWSSFGRFLPIARGKKRPIVLKKSDFQLA